MDHLQLSFIIPVYNCKDYIEKCIGSILTQINVMEHEVIVVDDCSTDGSWELIKSLYGELNSVSLIRCESNSGATTARIKGLQFAKGKYVAFVDADDYLMEDYISSVMSMLDGKVDYVGFGCVLEHKDGKMVDGGVIPPAGIYDRKSITENIFPRLISAYDGNTIPNNLWRFVCKKTIADEVMPKVNKNIIIGEDEVYVKACISRCKRIVMLEKRLYVHRFNPSSLTKSKRKRHFREIEEKYENLKQLLNEVSYDFSDQTDRAICMTAYNIASLQFGGGVAYRTARKRVIEGLNIKMIDQAINSAKFQIFSESWIKQQILKLKLCSIIYIQSR